MNINDVGKNYISLQKYSSCLINNASSIYSTSTIIN